jgi:putative endonuclease
MAAKHNLGRYGEDLAARFLTSAGMDLLDRNWRCPHGELDIIARDGSDVVIVEVKTRRSCAFGPPAEAVTRDKLARLRRLAAAWLAQQELGFEGVRIDVVAIDVGPNGAARVEHLRGVT